MFTAYTKANFRSLIRQMIDDENADMWSDANLDLLTQLTMDSMWNELLEINPWLVSQIDTVSSGSLTSPGIVVLTTAGNLTKRPHRIQKVVVEAQEYGQMSPKDVTLDGNEIRGANVSTRYRYMISGTNLHLFPYSTSYDVDVWYSHKPTAYDGLADGSAPNWPDSHEDALIYAVAARAMAKGGTEDTTEMKQLAADAEQRLKEFISKTTLGPQMPYYSDLPTAWGGE